MCACDAGFVCSRCRALPFDEATRYAEPLTVGEWDSLLASEQMQTAEPYDGRHERTL